jgi:formylglycine-generating enzyme required for sulfatase activity
VLAETREPALVLLGPPGCGKSTLLRRLELDLALEALRAAASDEAALSFFLPLNLYRPTQEGGPAAAPLDWLAAEWAERYPRLPPLADLLRSGKLVLLLDAINEIPHAGEEDYGRSIKRWRDFLVDLGHTARGTRVVFSCRSLDYTAVLSTPELAVPHVRIERLGEAQVEEFLTLYNREHGPTLWRRLKGTPQFDLFRSPFYLKMLLAQVGPDGAPPAGRAALFTGFVRQALHRELNADHPLLRRGALLEPHDHDRVIRNEWRDGVELPDDSPALHALRTLAFELQLRRGVGDVSRVRARRKDAIALLGVARGDALLRTGVALQVLEDQFGDVFYAHQLLQEYFAARALAVAPSPELARSAWRASEMAPSLKDVLGSLADSDPLPAAPSTGWEETFVLAAAMADAPDAFVGSIAEVNLPLAGRCAAQPDVSVSAHLQQQLQRQLVERSRDEAADLRARIAAARSLGELGDPRFERRRGPHGDYLLPPSVAVEGGEYVIGSDEGHYDDEAPVHRVWLAPFELGMFPVTNAEWQLFLDAKGYEDERWWQTEAAKRWREGKGVAEGPKAQWREFRKQLQANPSLPRQQLDKGSITSKQAENWEWYRDSSETEFERQLDDWYPSGRQTQPRFRDDPTYNHPAQPVVGICWYEARAYCAWLTAQSGRACRLPTEAEWEAAACGRPTRKWHFWRRPPRRYAWGKEFDASRCNSFETHVRGTTPIGVFPGGDTPGGLVDMTGNVWDWTSSLYMSYAYVATDGREDPEAEGPRVRRGGSWYYDRINCRCAYRLLFHPGARYSGVGFRVCFAPPIK